MSKPLAFGLFPLNLHECSYPEAALSVARAAEAAGFDSLWTGEHVVVPDPRIPSSRLAPEDRVLDPIVALTFLAAHTSRVLLGTGILILPQRNLVTVAKELATLDVLSGGRLILGIGVGYVEAEFRVLGVPFEDRGARTEEYLAAIRAL
jgi:alkanesulfonate monooxygenase SsuD/methylene tetrahydromethanopterin reductase-like flavin-dependent oxidoreductase (luciferase family)